MEDGDVVLEVGDVMERQHLAAEGNEAVVLRDGP